MRRFLLYSDHLLKEHGLDARADQALAEYNKVMNYSFEISQDANIRKELIAILQENKFFSDIGFSQECREYQHNIARSSWSVTTNTEERKVILSDDDFAIVDGFLASFVLKRDEFFSPKKYGFSSVADLHGSIGTYLAQKMRPSTVPTWNVLHNRTVLERRIRIHNGELKITQTDITSYPVKSPSGDVVRFRPITAQDQKVIISGRTEDIFRAVVQYALQTEQHGAFRQVFAKEITPLAADVTCPMPKAEPYSLRPRPPSQYTMSGKRGSFFHGLDNGLYLDHKELDWLILTPDQITPFAAAFAHYVRNDDALMRQFSSHLGALYSRDPKA